MNNNLYYNQGSVIVQNMINSGQFGNTGPMYNNMSPYGGMMNVGGCNYNQQSPYNQQQFNFRPITNMDTFNSPYDNGQQQNNGYNPYQQNNYYNGCNNYSPYQQTNYYNEYNNYSNPYQNSYYNGYNNYNPYQQNMYGSYNQFQEQQKREIELMKLKLQIAAAGHGKQYTDEELDRMLNPNHPANQITQEEAILNREFEYMKSLYDLFNKPQQGETGAMRVMRIMNEMDRQTMEHFGNHSFVEFINSDLPNLRREWWIQENIKPNNGRDLSGSYSTSNYNELLNMHAQSNPYISQLLNDSRYDGSIDDMELGLPIAANAEARRKALLEGKVPTFISSEETQKARRNWINAVFQIASGKSGG